MDTSIGTSKMSSPKSTLDLDVQVEEWDVRYRQLQDSLHEREERSNVQTDSGPDIELLISKALLTQAGRVGAMQCAASHKPSFQALLDHTREEMTADSVQQFTDRWLLQIAETAEPVAVIQESNDAILRQSSDVDAFFEEYPECARPDWDNLHATNEDDSSSDDEGTAQIKRLAIDANPSKKAKQPLQHVIDLQGKKEYHSGPPPSADGRPSRPSGPATKNPYQKQARHNSPVEAHTARVASKSQHLSTAGFQPATFSRNELPTAGSWDRNHYAQAHHPDWRVPQSQRNHGNKRAYAPATSSSSWDEHTNQQNPFYTAREVAQMMVDEEPPREQQPLYPHSRGDANPHSNYYPPDQIPMGYAVAGEESTRRGPNIPDSLRRKFQPPKRGQELPSCNAKHKRKPSAFVPSAKNGGVESTRQSNSSGRKVDGSSGSSEGEDEELPEELQHLDKELVKKIQNEIMESGDTVTFHDIAGLEDAKQTVQEVVCWPMKRPDLFTGLRRAPNGLLLYGPPGTGKTLIGKAIAHESGATFFSISSSSLTSKWIGEGEKLVKTLFAVAAYREPAVVFIDEIDSLLSQRKSTENEASRRIKTEFLVQLDGTGTSGQGRVLVIGATNKPQELDEAARRRFTKRLYIPLPEESDRRILIDTMLKKNNHQLTNEDIDRLARDTHGFSGADLKALSTDAAMGPIRQLGPKALEVDVSDVPPITYKHFRRSLKGTKPSVAPSDLEQYEEWDRVYGSKRALDEDDEDED